MAFKDGIDHITQYFEQKAEKMAKNGHKKWFFGEELYFQVIEKFTSDEEVAEWKTAYEKNQQKVGSNTAVKSKIAFLEATRRDLRALVAHGQAGMNVRRPPDVPRNEQNRAVFSKLRFQRFKDMADNLSQGGDSGGDSGGS